MADFSQWWWQAAGVDPGPGPGPGPDAGDPIGQSLRFRAQNYNSGSLLHRTGWADSGNVWTFSCWVKAWSPWSYTTAQQNATIFSWHTNGGIQTVDELYIFGNYPSNGRNEITHYMEGGLNGNETSNQEFNDPLAWYHIVWKSASVSDVTVWVNDVQVTDWRISEPFTSQNYINKNSTCSIGGRGPANTSPQNIQYVSQGSMAAVYFIDGQALDPSTFGRFNSQGVWVPVDPQGLTYGSNGFKLTFEDPSNIGKDYSGNGNDFTATGFDFAPPGVWSNFLTADSGANVVEPEAAFTDSGYSTSTNTPASITFAPNPPIFCSTFGIKHQEQDMTVSINGGAAEPCVGANGAFTDFNVPGGQLNTAVISRSNGSQVLNWQQTRLNGSGLLLNNTGTDYDLMADSPTQNYATINPLYPGASTSKANLTTANTTGKPTILGLAGNVGVDGASVAWDGTEAGWTSTGSINFGQQPGGFDEISTRTMPTPAILDGRDHFQAITGLGGEFYGNAIFTDNLNNSQGATPNTASIEFKGSNRGGCVSGGLGTRTLSGDPPGSWIIFRPDVPFENVTSLRIRVEHNYIGAAWVNDSPVDLSGKLNPGTTDWVDITPNVTPFTLRNFADKGTNSPAAQGTLYAIEINGTVLSGGLLEAAQQTFPNGLWWIKDRANSNQHQLVDSVNGQSAVITSPAGSVTAYAAPAGSSVAWCWNAANTDGGFSITNGTHGLGTTPAMVIDRALNVWHQSLPAGQGLVLKSSAAAAAQSWTVDGTTVSGPGGGSYYSWTSVPGYSAFGSYQGNGSADGPFIHTGHRSALILIKSTGSGDWHIYDSTREISNPETLPLRPNQTANESAIGSIDFLSNGFKLRTNTAINASANYVYAAFASCPFQSPATAR